MQSFVEMAGAVECQVDELRCPQQRVWFLKQVPERIRVVDIDHRYVHCKVVELPLNYHQVMVRYQFRTPPKGGRSREEGRDRCRVYVKLWIELLVAEKRRQMHVKEDSGLRPPHRPWQVKNVFSMPIVVWLSKQSKGPKRGAPEPGQREEAYYYHHSTC